MIDISKIFKPDGSIDNVVLRTEFEKLNTDLLAIEKLSDFQYYELALILGVNTIQHNLNFAPKSVIILNVIPSTTVITLDYENFTTTDIQLTATADCNIECLIGSYREDL